jgi:lysozyme
MKISEKGLALIKEFEGCKLKAYQDSVGIWTVGYGHTGPDVREGLEITQARAEELLREDLHDVERCLANSVSVTLTQNEYDALASFVFNLGCGRLRGSTLLRKLNAGDVDCGPEFDKWCNAGGRQLPGLVRRRKAERELFES